MEMWFGWEVPLLLENINGWINVVIGHTFQSNSINRINCIHVKGRRVVSASSCFGCFLLIQCMCQLFHCTVTAVNKTDIRCVKHSVRGVQWELWLCVAVGVMHQELGIRTWDLDWICDSGFTINLYFKWFIYAYAIYIELHQTLVLSDWRRC